jgi:hypothetical protein
MSALRGKADSRWSGFNQGRAVTVSMRVTNFQPPSHARQGDGAALDQNEALRYE